MCFHTIDQVACQAWNLLWAAPVLKGANNALSSNVPLQDRKDGPHMEMFPPRGGLTFHDMCSSVLAMWGSAGRIVVKVYIVARAWANVVNMENKVLQRCVVHRSIQRMWIHTRLTDQIGESPRAIMEKFTSSQYP